MLPESTAMFITRLSDLVPDGITYPVEQVVLRYLVDSRACPLCVAPPGSLCWTFGSQSLRHTHPARLDVPSIELRLIVEWAVLEHQGRPSEEA
jgi:hypothetical protein